MAQVILITSGKGGAGKTIVCALLGEALAARGKRVLLVEASRRSLDVLLGVSDSVVFDLADVLEGRCQAEDAALTPTGWEGRLRLLCAPAQPGFAPDAALCTELIEALAPHSDFILIEADGTRPEQYGAFAPACGRAVLVATPDECGVRGCREISDALAAAGVADIRLCVNQLTEEFLKLRPIPDLDWMIDTVCAQLVAVVPFDKTLLLRSSIGNSFNLSNISKLIFDNFAQRILGNYIDLLVQ